MTKMVYMVAWCLLLLALYYCGVQVRRKNGKMTATLMNLIIAGIVTVAANGVAVIATNETMAYVGSSFFYGSIDWLLMMFLVYAMEYCGRMSSGKILRMIIIIATLIDTASFLVNMGLHHVFSLKTVFYGGSTVYTLAKSTVFFDVHLAYCYVLVAMILVTLLHEYIIVPGIYRSKYGMVLIFFAFVIAFDGGVLLSDIPINISVFGYALLAAVLSYYTMFYSPKGITESMLTQVVMNMDDGMICYDMSGKCLYANSFARDLFHVGEDTERLEQYHDVWLQTNCTENQTEVRWQEEHDIDGKHRIFSAEYHVLLDDKNRRIGDYFWLTDKTEEVTRYDRERYRATHDALTGLYNRAFFYEKVEETLQENPDTTFYMVCSNIRDFKLINDLFGEEKGDEVLTREAELMRQFADPTTVCGRIGGDKFAVLVKKEVYSAKKFMKCIEIMQSLFTNQVYHMHIHMGVYEVTDHSEAATVICDRANLAIETIKNDYGTVIVHYDESVMEKTVEEKRIVAEFGEAMRGEQFQLYLQPQTDKNKTIVGAEALVRWQHPGRGMIPPGSFIDVLERSGLIWQMDQYIWEKSAAKLREWKLAGKTQMYISVNISAKDFYYADIFKIFTELVDEYKIDSANLKIEITESVFIYEAEKVFDVIKKLRAAGFCVEIDDFGSGYSSLNMLKDFKADVIKLDLGFLAETQHTERARIIMESIISMAKALGMPVVAEGVETEKQFEMLKTMDCDYYQGYYFAKPMPADYFELKYLSDIKPKR